MIDAFLTILNMSLTASYVILFIVLVRLPLKKAPKAISYALWSVAAFRLLCPFSFESILSLVPMNTSPIPQDLAYQQTPQINSGFTAVDTYVNRSLAAPITETGANSLRIYTQIGVYIWLLGITAMLIYSVVSVLILKSRLKSARHTEGNIYEADNLKTPFVLGVFEPRVFIPAGLPAEEKSYIIRHEQTHIHRLDHIIKPFAFLILSIHWFNPLVWIAFILMSTDMELSCDERVLKEMGGDIKKAYSISLLSLATEKRTINGSPLAFGEGDVQGRIKNVLNYKKPAFRIVIVSVTAVACVGIGLIANPRANAASEIRDNEYKNQKQPVSLTNFVIAENTVTLSHGKTVSVRLVMTDGKYFDEEYAGAGGGIYSENYQGNYEIQILNLDGNLISKTNFEDEGQPANFAGKFSLLFDDYNNDQNPDFSIGQWGSSSMDVYQLYTIMPDGTVKKISGEAFAHSGHGFSVKFNKDEDSGFYAQYYNNATGETVTAHYIWDKNKNSFKEDISAQNTIPYPATLTYFSELSPLINSTEISIQPSNTNIAYCIVSVNNGYLSSDTVDSRRLIKILLNSAASVTYALSDGKNTANFDQDEITIDFYNDDSKKLYTCQIIVGKSIDGSNVYTLPAFPNWKSYIQE